MMYDVLENYRLFLLKQTLRPETARTYTNRLEHLLSGQSLINTVEQLDMQKVFDNLSQIKYKNAFSQSKNALLYFLTSQNISLDEKYTKQLSELEKDTYKKYRKLHKREFKTIDSTIKHLKNEKLKLSYQVMLQTGLRVSELSQITPRKTTIKDHEICFYFTGKGGHEETVKVLKEENAKLYQCLREKIETTKGDTKLFYSANYLQSNAKKLGFTCHDLRRAFAKMEYQKTKSKDRVREKLRHTSKKTTELYLKSKIKM